MLGGSKGVCPLGRRTHVREGEAASRKEASERWKGEGRALSPPRRLGKAKSSDVALVISLLFLISNICVCYPHKMKESQ